MSTKYESSEGVVVSVRMGLFRKRKSLFAGKGPGRLVMGNEFKRFVLPVISDKVLACEFTLMSNEITRQLEKELTLPDIYTGLGDLEPLTPDELASSVCWMIQQQPNGEKGLLLTNGCANVFQVKLGKDNVVFVKVYWYERFPMWQCFAYDAKSPGLSGWFVGFRTFSRG